MKVEQEGTDFAPITITLETQEEADIMYAVLNCPRGQTLKHAYVGDISGAVAMSGLHQQMFDTFDNVYDVYQE